MGGRAAITTAPLPATADLVEATSAHVGSHEDANPGLPGAQKTTGRQSDAWEMGIDGATIAATPPLGSSLEVVCYDGPVDTREHLQPSATLVPAAEQPRPTAAVECWPNTAPLLQSDRGKKPTSAVDTVLDSDNSMATCTINPAPATNSGTRIPCNDKVVQTLSQTRFVASELYRPDAPNIPIRESLVGLRRTYCEAARGRPSSAWPNAQLARSKPRWRRCNLASSSKPPPTGY